MGGVMSTGLTYTGTQRGMYTQILPNMDINSQTNALNRQTHRRRCSHMHSDLGILLHEPTHTDPRAHTTCLSGVSEMSSVSTMWAVCAACSLPACCSYPIP